MVLRTIALLFFALALVAGVALGWNYPLGEAAQRVNAGAMASLQTGIERHVSSFVWEGVFSPLLRVPTWSLPAALGFIFVLVGLLRPGRG